MKDDSTGVKLATLMGKWDESLHYVMGDVPRAKLKMDPANIPEAVEVWQKSPPSKYPTRYNLTAYAITMNEITPGLEVTPAPLCPPFCFLLGLSPTGDIFPSAGMAAPHRLQAQARPAGAGGGGV